MYRAIAFSGLRVEGILAREATAFLGLRVEG
jgi:hypothetical protein